MLHVVEDDRLTRDTARGGCVIRVREHGQSMDSRGEVVREQSGETVPAVAPLPVAIVAADLLRRETLRALLRGHPTIVVQRAVGDAVALRDHGGQAPPDVVLLDVGSDAEHTFSQCVQLQKTMPTAAVVIVGVVAPYDGIADLIGAGATAFLMTEATADDIVAIAHDVVRGERSLPPGLTHSLFAQLVRERAALVDAGDSMMLTAREREIIALLAEGLSNKEIAARLHIAIHTVKSHVHNILGKLSLRSRLEVVAHARSMRGRP